MLRILSLTVLLSGAALAAYTGPKVQLTYLHGFTGPDRPVMEKLISQFNACLLYTSPSPRD